MPPRWKLPLAAPYVLCSLNAAWPAGVIGGTGSGLLLGAGPTHAPDRSCFGAGPGGFGIFGMPSEMNPSGRGRRPCADGCCVVVMTAIASAAASEAEATMELRTGVLLLCDVLLRGVRIVAGLAARIAAKLRVVQLGAILHDDLVQAPCRIAVLRHVHPHGHNVAGNQRRLLP